MAYYPHHLLCGMLLLLSPLKPNAPRPPPPPLTEKNSSVFEAML